MKRIIITVQEKTFGHLEIVRSVEDCSPVSKVETGIMNAILPSIEESLKNIMTAAKEVGAVATTRQG